MTPSCSVYITILSLTTTTSATERERPTTSKLFSRNNFNLDILKCITERMDKSAANFVSDECHILNSFNSKSHKYFSTKYYDIMIIISYLILYPDYSSLEQYKYDHMTELFSQKSVYHLLKVGIGCRTAISLGAIAGATSSANLSITDLGSRKFSSHRLSSVVFMSTLSYHEGVT